MNTILKPESHHRDDAAQTVVDLETKGAVKRSASGQLSVSLDDVSKTPTFRRDLRTLTRIRELVKVSAR